MNRRIKDRPGLGCETGRRTVVWIAGSYGRDKSQAQKKRPKGRFFWRIKEFKGLDT
jgi:hypothetical protein